MERGDGFKIVWERLGAEDRDGAVLNTRREARVSDYRRGKARKQKREVAWGEDAHLVTCSQPSPARIDIEACERSAISTESCERIHISMRA